MSSLLLDSQTDAAEWHGLLDRLPGKMRDVYFWPEYVSLYRLDSNSKAVLFVYKQSENLWIYPFLINPIISIGHHTIEPLQFDIESPYGYGGPLSNSEDPSFIAEAQASFDEWCVSKSVVAEFTRFHPLLQNHKWHAEETEILFDRKTVSICLSGIGLNYSPQNPSARNKIRRAEKDGIQVSAYPTNTHLDQFLEIYLPTMDRLKADEYYYFDRDYFVGLTKLPEDSGLLLAAEFNQRWIAAAFFLKGSKWLHYHLSGRHPDYRAPGAANLLISTAAEIGSQLGLKLLHLGGGNSQMVEDPLLQFKQSMASSSHEFYIGKRVHNGEAYETLRAIWSQQYPSLVPKYGRRLLCYRYKPEE